MPPHLQSAMDAGELQIYRNFLAGQDKERLRELYTLAWNDCKPRNAGLPNARAIQQLVQVWKALKGR